MKYPIRLFVNLLVPALLLVFATATPAMKHEAEKGKAAPAAKDAKTEKKAEKGKPATKVLHEDDKVRVTETTFKPGDVGPSTMRGFRVVRALKGGTIERIYPDGKKEKVERKTGEVVVQGPDKQAYSIKNIGKTDYVTYAVTLKGVK